MSNGSTVKEMAVTTAEDDEIMNHTMRLNLEQSNRGYEGLCSRQHTLRLYKLLVLIITITILTLIFIKPASAQINNGNLSGNMPPFADVDNFQISSDDQYVIFIADLQTDDAFELYSTSLNSSTGPVRLSGPVLPGDTIKKFLIGTDNSKVIYLAPQDKTGVIELYSVSIDGDGGLPIKLNDTLTSGGNVGDFRLSSDGNRVVYRADQVADEVYELYSVSIDGGSPIKLNNDPSSGGGVTDFQISRDGSRVIYRGIPDLGQNSTPQLYSVQIDGGSPIRLSDNNTSVSSGEIQEYGNQIVYFAEPKAGTSQDFPALYSVPINGGGPIKLSDIVISGGSVQRFKITPDGSRVVYSADQEIDNVYELYSIPINGGGSIRLNGILVSGGSVGDFRISQNGSHVVYQADQETDEIYELYSVPIDGGLPIKLNNPLIPGGDVGYFRLSPDGNRVIYQSDQVINEVYELYSVSIDGGNPIKLNDTLISSGDVGDFQISRDGSHVVYQADQETDEIYELYSVPLDGGRPFKLNGTLVSGGSVKEQLPDQPSPYDEKPYLYYLNSFLLNNASSHVIYIADEDTDGVDELYASYITAPGLILEKTVSTNIAKSGDTLTYTIMLSATIVDTAFALTDTIPISMTLMEYPDTFTYDEQSQRLRISNGIIELEKPIVIHYSARVNDNVTPGSILYSEVEVDAYGETYSSGAAVAIPVSSDQQKPLLTIIYAVGDNNLSKHIHDLFHMAEAGSSNPDMYTLLLYDDVGDGDVYYYLLQSDQTMQEVCPSKHDPFCEGRYELDKNVWRWKSESVATQASLREFLTAVILAFPTDKIFVSLVGHGGGWSPDLLPGQPGAHSEKPNRDPLGGFLWDENPQSSLSTSELGETLKEVTKAIGRPIDLLYFDSCLMAMSEVAYELRGSAHYLLASESWSWTSFRYDLHLSISSDLSVEDIGKKWIENEAHELRNNPTGDYPFTYSLIDLQLIEELKIRVDDLASELINSLQGDETLIEMKLDPKTLIKDAYDVTACFDGNQNYTINDNEYYCDLHNFAIKLSEKFPQTHPIALAAIRVTELITDTLVKGQDQEQGYIRREGVNELWEWEALGGISIYMPLGENDWKRSFYSTALQFTLSGKWDEFLDAYWGVKPPSPPEACESNCAIQGAFSIPEDFWYLPIVMN